MKYSHASPAGRRPFFQFAGIIAAICLLGPSVRAQDAPAPTQSARPPLQEFLDKHPGFLEELGQLFERLGNNVQLPAARSESRLLPLLPASTVSYAALPNYGNTANQALVTFRQALEESPALRAWWQSSDMASTGPKLESFFEKFSQLHQYLGEEIVVSAAVLSPEPRPLAVAEIRKPGLREFLSQMVRELAGSSKPSVLVFDPETLAAAKDEGSSSQLLVLIRPDFAVAAVDFATLRNFNALLDGRSREFASTPFGLRAAQEYQGGLTILVGVHLQELLKLLPPAAGQDPTFQRTGFADLKYFIWGHKSVAGKTVSQSEFSFAAPRHGIAAWLANPAPLGSLDFLSPKALIAGSVRLMEPPQIFDDVKALATLSNPKAFADLEQFEQGLQLSLKNDLLAHMSGELTLELTSVTPPQPMWKAILGVRDAESLQQTLNALLAVMPLQVQHSEDAGVAYHTFQIPSGQTAMEISYSLLDGYLVIGSGQQTVAEAVRLHRSGESLGKSSKLLAALPPGHPQESSGLLYVDPKAMTAIQMRRLAPEMAEAVLQSPEELAPFVMCVDGQETAIRQSTTSPMFDTGAVLVVAAIAIPNLLRARITANETSAVGSLRTVNTVQVQYSAMYPERGFAPDLATLGPGPGGAGPTTADHADLLDMLLADPSCTGDTWCQKSGFLFRVNGVCAQLRCDDYVVYAKPVTPGTTGTRSFCSTSDGVIRASTETPPPALTVEECRAWAPLGLPSSTKQATGSVSEF